MSDLHVSLPLLDKESALLDYTDFVLNEAYGSKALYLSVEGIKCGGCAVAIEDVLNKEIDVTADVNPATKRLALHWRGDISRGNELVGKAAALGYKFLPYDQGRIDNSDKQEEHFLLRCMVVAGAASANIMLLMAAAWVFKDTDVESLMHELVRWVVAPIAIPAVLYSGRPFFFSAWNALKNKRSNMDVPISLALILTSAMSLFEVINRGENSYFDSVVMLVFLLLIGRYLDRRTRGKARAAAQDLLAMMTGTSTIIKDGITHIIPVRDLKSGMLLQVAAGEKIAADGVIENGSSEVDPSFITGETITQFVEAGTKVFGGMINVISPVTVRITASSGESLLSEIISLMEKAEQGHAQFVRLADKVARYYTPTVLILSLGTFLAWLLMGMAWQPALLIAMTVLIITCPCAMGLVVPAVQVIASSRLFRNGMLLKSADALERMAQVDTIVFDKTGTLTIGKPKLVNAKDISSEQMQLAASLAAHSRHPLARSLRAEYNEKLLDLNITEIAGKGLEASYNNKTIRLGRRDWCGDINAPQDENMELWLGVFQETRHSREGGNPAASVREPETLLSKPIRFIFEDELRPDAQETISKLQQEGFAIELLSGDREPVVAAVAKKLGITTYRSKVSPIEKCQTIEMLRQRGHKVMMVGDGLNDAPALSTADVSMSPSTALDITQNAADIVFQGNHLNPVLEAINVSKKSDKLVRQNFLMAFLYNILAVPLAMFGMVTPLIAAIAMSASSLIVVANAQRLHRK